MPHELTNPCAGRTPPSGPPPSPRSIREPVLASDKTETRRQLEEALNTHLAAHYSTRWSAGVSNEAAPLLSSWGLRRERSASLHSLLEPPAEDDQSKVLSTAEQEKRTIVAPTSDPARPGVVRESHLGSPGSLTADWMHALRPALPQSQTKRPRRCVECCPSSLCSKRTNF